MPLEILRKGDNFYAVDVTWIVRAGQDMSESFLLNVDETVLSFVIGLEWISKAVSPIYIKLFLKKSRDAAETNPSLSICSVWASFNDSEKNVLSKRPSLEEWISEPIDSSIHCIVKDESLLRDLRLVMWIQMEANNDKLAMMQFHRLLKDQLHCDVYFRFKEEKIGSHVAILAARCPVFAAMFQHDTREMQSREIVIEDIEREAFYELLNYIYSGQPSSDMSVTTARSLYEAADKYCVNELKDMCLKFLSSNFEISNVIQTLVWAHFHNVLSLKRQALDFMSLHSEEISKLSEWEDLIRNHFDAFSDALNL